MVFRSVSEIFGMPKGKEREMEQVYNFADEVQLESLRQLIVEKINQNGLSEQQVTDSAYMSDRSLRNYKTEGYLASLAPLSSSTVSKLKNLLTALNIEPEEALEYHQKRIENQQNNHHSDPTNQNGQQSNTQFQGCTFNGGANGPNVITGNRDITLNFGAKD